MNRYLLIPLLLLMSGCSVEELPNMTTDDGKATYILRYMEKYNKNIPSYASGGFTGVNYNSALRTIKDGKWDFEKMEYKHK